MNIKNNNNMILPWQTKLVHRKPW